MWLILTGVACLEWISSKDSFSCQFAFNLEDDVTKVEKYLDEEGSWEGLKIELLNCRAEALGLIPTNGPVNFEPAVT